MPEITPFTILQQLVGTKELKGGQANNPLILAMIACCDETAAINDEVPWCSACINFIAKLSNTPRSKSLAAKSWLKVGHVIPNAELTIGWDVVILNRTSNPALGHVGLFAGWAEKSTEFWLLAGNQSNSISLQKFNTSEIEGCRRLD